MIKLTKEQVILLHEELIQETGGLAGIRSRTMLDSAINVPFLDGNKRIGAHAMLVFPAINGIVLEYEQGELATFILRVGQGGADTSDILRWIIDHERD